MPITENNYRNAPAREYDVTNLMRRINALQAGIGSSLLPIKRLWHGGSWGVPSRVSVDSSGSVYVSDYTIGGVEKWTPTGRRIWRVDSVNGQSDLRVVVGANDVPYAVDVSSAAVYIMNASNGAYVSTYIAAPPTGIWTFDSSGNGYCLNQSAGSLYISKYDNAGTFVTSWTIDGAIYIFATMSIDISPSNILYMSYIKDYGGANTPRVAKCTTTGASLTNYTFTTGWANGNVSVLTLPFFWLTAHSDGFIYIYSYLLVQKFNTSMVFQARYGADTSGLARLIQKSPFGISQSAGWSASIHGRNGYLFIMDYILGPIRLGEQTEWSAYGEDATTSLGAPDGGVSVPALNGLSTNDALFTPAHLDDLRFAIEAISYESGYQFYTTPVHSATNASPIVVTLDAAIPVQNNSLVRVYGALGNTAANGTFNAQNITGGGRSFDLAGSTGNGVYVTDSALCVLVADHLFLEANSERASAYNAQDSNHGWWSRPYSEMCGPNIVVGTDGYDWESYNNGSNYTVDMRPITGAAYGQYFRALGTSGKGRAYVNYYYYTHGRSVVAAAISGNAYQCIEDHIATADNAPETGIDGVWQGYWEDLGIAGTYVSAHTVGVFYSCNKPYDIDIGEIANCVVTLEGP